MNEMQVFNNPEFGQLRTVMIDGEPWAVGKDVAAALGYAKPTDAVRKKVDPEDRGISKMETPSGEQETTVINESGLYALILSSKLPTAKRFKRWVTSEVLPALRKAGSYTVQGVEPEQRPLTTDDYLNAARILAGCRDERLPLVMPLLRQAGIRLPQIEEPKRQSIVHPIELPEVNVKIQVPPPWRASSLYTPEERARMKAETLARYPQLAE